MNDHNDLRAALTRYAESDNNMVLNEDFKIILAFISWLEATEGGSQ